MTEAAGPSGWEKVAFRNISVVSWEEAIVLVYGQGLVTNFSSVGEGTTFRGTGERVIGICRVGDPSKVPSAAALFRLELLTPELRARLPERQ